MAASGSYLPVAGTVFVVKDPAQTRSTAVQQQADATAKMRKKTFHMSQLKN
jgi:hypothetical protein